MKTNFKIKGHDMITDLEKVCKLRFDQSVTSKIFLAAMKTKPDLKFTEKTVRIYVESKKWKRVKELFHQQFKRQMEIQEHLNAGETKDKDKCVIS